MTTAEFEERANEARSLIEKIKEDYWNGVSTADLCVKMAELEFVVGEMKAERERQEAA